MMTTAAVPPVAAGPIVGQAPVTAGTAASAVTRLSLAELMLGGQ
jgi:hypothetical protein